MNDITEEDVEEGFELYRNALAYVLEAIKGFDKDPADTDFQRGYLAALQAIAHEAFHQSKPHIPFKS